MHDMRLVLTRSTLCSLTQPREASELILGWQGPFMAEGTIQHGVITEEKGPEEIIMVVVRERFVWLRII